MRPHPPQPASPASPPAPASPNRADLGFLAAIGLNLAIFLFAFSLWAEWGPYAWCVAVQMALGESYRGSLPFLFTFCVFLAPAVFMYRTLRPHGRTVLGLAFAVPALALATHFAVAVWFSCQGGQPDPNASFADSLRAANFLPRAIVFDASQLPPLDQDQITRITKSRRWVRDGGNGDYYVPFVPAAWPDPQTPVYLTCRNYTFPTLGLKARLSGIVRKAPFPYLVRRHAKSDLPTLGIIIDLDESVRTFWMLPAILDLVCTAMAIKALSRL